MRFQIKQISPEDGYIIDRIESFKYEVSMVFQDHWPRIVEALSVNPEQADMFILGLLEGLKQTDFIMRRML